MKKNYKLIYTLAAGLMFSLTSWSQLTVTQWNFNGDTASTVPGGTSNPTPSIGAGSLAFVGGTNAVSPDTDFPSGASSGGSSDPVVTTPNTNFAWGITNYAAQGAENKQRGIQINVSTVNYTGISLAFDQRLSNTANNTYVVQYTTNRLAPSPVWVDAQTFTFTPADTGTGDTWYNLRTVNFSGVAGLNNNSAAAFRIVSAFDPVANAYVAAKSTSTYAGTGTNRFDMITVSATGTLGLPGQQAADHAFTIYPNPSNKEIVYFNEAFDIEVYTIAGKVIHTAKNVTSLDTAEYSTGVYFVKNQNGAVQKLIVK